MPDRGDAQIALDLAGTIADTGWRELRASSRGATQRLLRRVPDEVPRTRLRPIDEEILADPYPWYRQLHSEGPLHYNRSNVWFVSGYDAVRAASRDHQALSSAESVTRYRSRLPMMLTMDRPDHARLRRIAAPEFTRGSLEAYRPAVELLAREAVEALTGAEGDPDLVELLASPLPVAVIAHVLGVPQVDLPNFRRWSDWIVEGFGAARGSQTRASIHAIRATFQLHRYLREQSRTPGGDGMLARLRSSSEEGRLSEDELFWFAFLLLVAGNETTTNLLGTMLLTLGENPEAYARLRREPELIPAAVEESLRFVSPIQGFFRTALADFRVGRATIPSGARVLLLFGAANRDPDHYPDPDRFVVDRDPGDHLAFGSGIHFCLGAHLARLEARVVLAELVDRVESIELTGEPRWGRNPALRGLTRLPLRLVPA